MINLKEGYEKEMLAELEHLGFSPIDAKNALVDVQKVILLRLSRLVDARLSDKEKKIFTQMAEDKSDEEMARLVNHYFREEAPLSREEAEKVVNEVWSSYISRMSMVA